MSNIIDAVMFRNMINCGAKYLEINKEVVDSLNVFPVPDGDTGSNMYLTILSAVKEVSLVEKDDVVEISNAMAKGALKGARGNSGVILSQILKGFSKVLDNRDGFDTLKFADALLEGSKVAYSAVTKPKEGTILTVIRVMAEYAKEIAPKQPDPALFLQAVLARGEEILKQTPELLPVLKKAGVVDAGGRGLLCILYGFYNVCAGLDISESMFMLSESEDTFTSTSDEVEELGDDIKFAYCTEFFIDNIYPKTTEADIDNLRNKLMKIGDSVIAIGDLSLVKVHVHTNHPGKALNYAVELGELDKVKIENMLEQHRQLMEKKLQEHKPIGMVSVCAGKGLGKIFKDIGVDYVIEGGQTMNPSVDDIAKAVNKVNADVVFIYPNNKNIILAADAAKAVVNKPLYVIPTKNIAQGISAALSFDPNATPEDNEQGMLAAIDTVKCGEVTYAVRTTSIDGFNLKEGDIISIFDGKINAKDSAVDKVVSKCVSKMVTDDSALITLYYGEGVAEADALALVEKLSVEFPDMEVAAYEGGQPNYFYFVAVE